MLAFALPGKYLRNRINNFGCMFQAIDQVVGILALEALVECKLLLMIRPLLVGLRRARCLV
jgi:hypothetical protein